MSWDLGSSLQVLLPSIIGEREGSSLHQCLRLWPQSYLAPYSLFCSTRPRCLSPLKWGRASLEKEAVWGRTTASLWACPKHGHWLPFNIPQQRLDVSGGQPSVTSGLTIVGENCDVREPNLNLAANNSCSWETWPRARLSPTVSLFHSLAYLSFCLFPRERYNLGSLLCAGRLAFF